MEIALTAGRRIGVAQLNIRNAVRERLEDDRGEGVISMAIAILVVAALGVAMYAVFKGVGDSAGTKAEKQLDKVGT